MDNDTLLPATVLVIFGITGDLSHRYLLPALAAVTKAGKLPQDFKIIGISRRQVELHDIYAGDLSCLMPHSQQLQMDMDSIDSYKKLESTIEEVAKSFNRKPEIIYYLSVPPPAVLPIIEFLGEASLNQPNAKLLLEKPFGINLESARQLIEQTQKHFPEKQVYRIDHYLAKEMAQNIVVFLGSNSLFRHAWSNAYIEKIEIEAAERIGIENRVNFYDSTGALRDLVQSHLLQLAALTLMEPCSSRFEFDELPVRRLAALSHLKVVPESVKRGQYNGYKDEVHNPDSITETFVAMNIQSDDPRWKDVPISLITGKNLKEKLTEIRVYFKRIDDSESNLLTLRIQPQEAIVIQLWVKQPGYERKLQQIPHEFTYGKHFEHLPDAYEQVLVDAIRSNHSLFASSAEVLMSWEILQPVQEKWNSGDDELVIYAPGSTSSEVLEQATNSKQ